MRCGQRTAHRQTHISHSCIRYAMAVWQISLQHSHSTLKVSRDGHTTTAKWIRAMLHRRLGGRMEEVRCEWRADEWNQSAEFAFVVKQKLNKFIWECCAYEISWCSIVSPPPSLSRSLFVFFSLTKCWSRIIFFIAADWMGACHPTLPSTSVTRVTLLFQWTCNV